MKRSSDDVRAHPIAIVGGRGYLGSNLADHIEASGRRFWVVDRDIPIVDHKVNREYRNISPDIAVAVRGAHTVVHLATLTTPATGESNPGLDMENVRFTIELISACKAENVRHIIFASSGGTIYGDVGKRPAVEADIPRPSCSYAIAKLACEHYLRLATRDGKLSATVLRISNLYGGGQTVKGEQGVIGYLVAKIAAGEKFEIMGDTVRDYIHIDDACRAFLAAIITGVNISTGDAGESAFRLCNVSTGVGTSLSGLIDIVARAYGRKAEYSIGHRRFFDLPFNVLDNTIAREILNWTPRIALEDGVASCICPPKGDKR